MFGIGIGIEENSEMRGLGAMYRLCISRQDSSSYRNFSAPRSELSTINLRPRDTPSHHPNRLDSFFPRVHTCNSSTKSSPFLTILIPLPPPPALALTKTGYPILSASFLSS